MSVRSLIFLGLLVTLFSHQVECKSNSNSKKTVKESVKIFYYKNIFGNVHQNPSNYSAALTTITCGHPVKVYLKQSNLKNNQSWKKVKVGPYTGHIYGGFLIKKRPSCFQDEYPRFFDMFEMDLADLYYWARLYDQYIQGESQVR